MFDVIMHRTREFDPCATVHGSRGRKSHRRRDGTEEGRGTRGGTRHPGQEVPKRGSPGRPPGSAAARGQSATAVVAATTASVGQISTPTQPPVVTQSVHTWGSTT